MCAPLSCANAKPSCADETVTSNLFEHVARSCDVLDLTGGVRCVANCLSTLDFSENVCQDSHSLRVWVER